MPPALTRPLLALVLLLGAVLATTPAADAVARDLPVTNGSFSAGKTGWRPTGSATGYAVARGGHTGPAARLLAKRRMALMSLEHARPTVGSTAAGRTYVVGAWLRSPRRLPVALRVREVAPSGTRLLPLRTVLPAKRWTQVRLTVSPRWPGSSLRVSVAASNVRARDVLRVDDVTLRVRSVGETPTPTPPPAAGPVLPVPSAPPGDCAVSPRGIPSCGAYMGAGVGLNEDPAAFERKVGAPLGVHRLFYQASGVGAAVAAARTDLAHGRLPWLSFKLPYSWTDMAAGRGDAWARDLATRLAALDGPVWVAFHHEPENDGDIAAWTRTQSRLSPIVRSAAPNVAFTAILMGYHSFYGDRATYNLDRILPAAAIDVVGIDPYNYFGVPGRDKSANADLVKEYFQPLAAWARSRGVAWGVAETGYTDRALADDPHWLLKTFRGLRANGGVALSYFNSAPASATGDWLLDTPDRIAAYAEAQAEGVRLPAR